MATLVQNTANRIDANVALCDMLFPLRLGQKRCETSLLKMMVSGERFLDVALLHHHETNAIGQRPILVRPTSKQFCSPFERRVARRNDLDSFVCLNKLEQFDETVSVLRLGKCVADLYQKPLRGHNGPGKGIAQGDGLSVARVGG